MNKKTLVICGNCERNGNRASVLGEIDEEGYFVVMRFHKGFTKIKSQEFSVICGACGNVTFQRSVTQILAIPKNPDGTVSL